MVESKRNKVTVPKQAGEALDIWIISLFESTPIDNTRPMRFAGLTEAALKSGHHISHFSCTFRHSTKFERFPERKELEVKQNHTLVFIYGPPYKANISWARMKSHDVFTRNLLQEFKQRKKPDLVLVTLPPLSSVSAVCTWAEKNNIPVVVDIIDPWPDVFLTLAPKLLRPALKLCFFSFYNTLRQIFKRTTAVTSISKEYVQWAKSFGTEFKYTGVFYPAVDFKGVTRSLNAKPRSSDDPKIRIIYAGNLASSYDIPCILSAAELLESKHPGRTEFVICGVGPQETLIRERMKVVGNIKYLGRLGHDDLMSQYANADLGLTQHVAGATQSVTYKFFDYLGAGLPILNSLQSEMSTLISENYLGLNNVPGNGHELAHNIELFLNDRNRLKQYKQNAVDFTAKNGDAEVVYSKMVGLLEQIALKRSHV
jgi:glycosyltransferase involved in cell wall biosynthesis